MRARRSLVAIAAILVAASMWFGYHSSANAGVRVVVFSVGQGDCTLIQDGSRTVLIDAGPASDGFDAGERLVAPKLRALGVDRIDLVLLSHPDADHIGGLSGIAKRFRIGRVAFPHHFGSSSAMQTELSEARIETAKRFPIQNGWRFSLNRLRLEMAVPEWSPFMDDNDGSMFVKLVADTGHGAVFTGDASEEVELSMAGAMDWRAEILKAGHHGSRFSTSAAFLNRVKPKFVVFSCGKGNAYGHPAEETVLRAVRSGAETFRTDLDGDLRFELGQGGWELKR